MTGDDFDETADSDAGADDTATDGDDDGTDDNDGVADDRDEDADTDAEGDTDDADEPADDAAVTDDGDPGPDAGDSEPTEDDSVSALDDATDEAATDESATDETATDDATDETATDDATDETATDDATDEIATDDDSEETPLPVIEQAVPNDPARAAAGRLLLQVTTAKLNAVPGARNLLFISVGNTSNEAVEGVTAVFTVPPGMQFNGASDAHPDASCYLNNCAPEVEATWNLGTIGAGETRTLEVNVLVEQSATDGSNIAAHVVVNAPGQSTLVVDKSFPVTTTAREAELALTSESDPLLPGQSTDLHVDVGQIGDLPLEGAVVKLALPRGVSVLGALANGGVQDEDGVTWTLGDVSIGASLKRTVRVMVDDSASPGNVYNPTATLTFTTERAVTEVSQLPISVIEEHAPLTLKVAAEQTPGSASGRLRYFATVSNTGSRTVPATSLWFRQPVETASNGVADAAPDQSCYLNGCNSGVEAIWPLGDVQPGETLFFEVNPAIHAAVTVGNLVSTYFALFPAQGGHVCSSMTVPVNTKAAAEHHLGASKTPVVPGETFTYTLHVGQVGAASLQNTRLALQLPPGVTPSSISDGGVDEGNGKIAWDVGTVAVAAHAKRSVDVSVGADVPVATVLEARSELRYDGGAEVDAASEDLVAVVEALPPLTMTVQIIPEGETTAPAYPVGVPGDRVLVRATVTNTSARPIEGATMVLRMPKAMAFNGVADATPDASCYLNNCAAFVESVFPLGTLAAGQALIVDTNTTVSADALPGSLMALTPRVYGTGVTQHVMLQSVVPIGN